MPDRQTSDSTLRGKKQKCWQRQGFKLARERFFKTTHGDSDYLYGWQVKISTNITGFGKCGNSDFASPARCSDRKPEFQITQHRCRPRFLFTHIAGKLKFRLPGLAGSLPQMCCVLLSRRILGMRKRLWPWGGLYIMILVHIYETFRGRPHPLKQ